MTPTRERALAERPRSESRFRRALRLSEAVRDWQRLAESHHYPRSLVDILETALRREYDLGRTRGRGDRRR
jgi:hypothetical protein